MILLEEEFELFKEIIEDEIDGKEPITINGDVYISVNNGKGSLKNIRSKITKNIKRKIKERDSETCLCCGRKFETHLEVHHIMPLSRFPELATIPENMASLCQQCHARYHELYKYNEGAVSFAKYLKQYGR